MVGQTPLYILLTAYKENLTLYNPSQQWQFHGTMINFVYLLCPFFLPQLTLINLSYRSNASRPPLSSYFSSRPFTQLLLFLASHDPRKCTFWVAIVNKPKNDADLYPRGYLNSWSLYRGGSPKQVIVKLLLFPVQKWPVMGRPARTRLNDPLKRWRTERDTNDRLLHSRNKLILYT